MRSAISRRARRMPLPPVLAGRFASEPKWVDLRAYRDGADRARRALHRSRRRLRRRHPRHAEGGFALAGGAPAAPRAALAWSAAGSLLILAGLAGWQWKVALDNERAAIEQRKLAQEQRDRAERTLAAATETANSLVFDLAREFRDRAGMPRDLVRRILDRAQRAATATRQIRRDARRALAAARPSLLSDLVDTLLALGDTKAALAAAERARAIMEELAAADPGNTQWQRDLSVSHTKIGDVLVAAGRREEALAEYRRSLAIREKLAATIPATRSGSATCRSATTGSATCWRRRGDVRRRWRNTARAWPSREARRRRSRQHRVAARPVGQPQQDRRRAGGAGRREEALAAYRRSLAIAEKLAAADPGNTEWQRDLSVSHDRIGDVLVAAGRREEALAAYRRSLAIREKLAAADPGNTEWQRDLSVSHDRIGDVLAARGGRGGAGGLPQEPRDRARRSPPPIPATPSGSATCRSATTRSATC